MRYAYNVTLDIPDNLDRASVQEYFAEAVANWMGCYHPSSAILQARQVKVRGKDLSPLVREIGYGFYDPDYDL